MLVPPSRRIILVFMLLLCCCLLFVTATMRASRSAADSPGSFFSFTISGNVQADGVNLPGATLVLGGAASATTTTDASGNYSFTASGGSYSVSIYKNGYTFNPASQAFNNLQANQTANFQNGVPLCVPQSAGLVAWYRAEDNATDASGNGNNASLQNGAGFSNGKVRRNFLLDGVNDYVDIPDVPSVSPTTAVSLQAWIKPHSVGTGQAIISNLNASTDNGSFHFVISANGSLQFNVQQSTTVFRSASTNSSVIAANVYTHVAATFDTSTQAIKIYVNGVDMPTTISGSNVTSLFDVATHPRIGAYTITGTFGAPFNGEIDEAQIYNRALSSVEVQNNYVAGSVGICTAAPGTMNGKIAFVRIVGPNNQIFTMNADGSNQTDLSNTAQDDLMPTWSPDGSKLAFLSTRGNNGDIYTMNSDGSNQTRLTTAVDADQAPGWSPDGSKIVFTSYRDGNLGEIYVMDANGSNQTRLTNNSSVDYAPKFSPSGSKIVFYTNRDGSYEIYSMSPDGSNQTRLTNNAWDDQFPEWSPDGSKITCHSFISGIYRVSVMNADGSNQVQVTNSSSNNLFPAWSPDGTKIVFTSERDGNREIYTMNPDGTSQVRLFSNSAADYAPVWQPLGYQGLGPTPLAGTPDLSFGSSGKVTTPIGSGNDNAYAEAIQADGKIVAAGSSHNGTNLDFALSRYNSDGTLDVSFGTGGKVTTAIGGANDEAYAVAVQSDGKIVAAGYTFDTSDNDTDAAIVRYNTNGTIDTSFGNDGLVILVFAGSNEVARALAIQPDGKIFVAEPSDGGDPNTRYVFLYRYLSDGSFDQSFVSYYEGLPTNGGLDVAVALAIQADGRLVVGYSNKGSNYDFALARYDANGLLDDSFDSDGLIKTSIGGGDDFLNGIAIQTDGKIVASGSSFNGSNADFATARYNTDGSADGSFGVSGKVTTAIGSSDDVASSLAIQTDGRIVLAGRSSNGSNADFAVVRYNTNGSLDTAFNLTGKVVTPIGSGDDKAVAIGIQSDGKLVLAGYSFNGSNNDFALVRYNADGTTNISVQPISSLSVVFSAITQAGNLVATPLTASQLPLLPQAYALPTNLLAYDIRTSATYSGSVVVTFKVPNIASGAACDLLRSLHFENGSWTATNNAAPIFNAGTSTCTVSQTVTSLSPFVVAQLTVPEPQTIQFSQANYSVNENGGQAIVTVSRSGGSSGTVTVDCSTGNGSAVAASDYTATSGILTFNPGEVSKTIIVPILDDGFYEGNETINLSLTNVTGGAALGAQSTATVTINDNETQPTVSINDIVIIEPLNGTTTATFTASLSGAAAQAVTVDYATANNSATAPADYLSIPTTTLTFNPGEVSKTVNVTVNTDAQLENLETFFLNLSNATGATISDNQGVGSIRQQYGNGKIVFQSNRSGNSEIYSMNAADGSALTNLTNNAVAGGDEDVEPSVSLDGSKIVFVSNRTGGIYNLWSMNADGTNQIHLTLNGVTDHGPSWSPDGAKIAFTSNQSTGAAGLWTANADGSNRTELTSVSGETIVEPSWSPDGRKIAFASNRSGNYEIYVINSDGSGLAETYHDPGVDSHPRWSPDGSRILFWTNRDGHPEVYAMNPDGTGQTRITTGTATNDTPAWSPDGSRIVFRSSRDGNTEIYVMNSDGSAQTRLTNNSLTDDNPSWQAVGPTAGALQFSSATYNVNENGTATVTVTRVGVSNDAVAVAYATSNGTAAAGTDYTSASGTLTWNAGQGGGKTFTVPILDDSVAESSETISLTLSNATNGATLGAPSSAVLTVIDNDGAGQLDLPFGGTGKVVTAVPFRDGFIYSSALQADGKIVVAGSFTNGSNSDLALARYNINGDLDTSFGSAGRVVTSIGSGNDVAYGVAIQKDGKIVAGGYTSSGAAGSDDFAVARYNSDGTLDGSFGIGGIVVNGIGGSDDVGYTLTLQPDGKIIIAGATYTSGNNSIFGLIRYNPNGTLDQTFGSGGRVTDAVGGLHENPISLVVQSDGKILAGGEGDNNGSDYDLEIVRYNSNGSRDTSFNGTGKVITPVGSLNDLGGYLALQTDGKIILAGAIEVSGQLNRNFGLLRYNSNGTPDTSFGTNGKTSVEFGNLNAIKIQADGRIVAVGSSNNGSNTDFAVARYNTNGSLDSSFGVGGKVTTTIGNGNEGAYSVAIQTDGMIVASGYANDGVNNYFALVRYHGDYLAPSVQFSDATYSANENGGSAVITVSRTGDLGFPATVNFTAANGTAIAGSDYTSTAGTLTFAAGVPTKTFSVVLAADNLVEGNETVNLSLSSPTGATLGSPNTATLTIVDVTTGQVDTGFGRTGIITTQIGSSDDAAYGVAIQADGKIVAVGSGTSSTPDFAIVRYNPDGSLDNSFGTGGRVITPFGNSSDVAYAVAIQSDGKIVAAGTTNNGSNYDFALARYRADGSLDPSFGSGGKVTTALGNSNDLAFAVVIQTDGNIVAGGYGYSGAPNYFGLARYYPNGALDPSFGTGGKVLTPIGGADDYIASLALQTDGRIVAAGYAAIASNLDFALARYNTDGSLDSSFNGTGKITTAIGTQNDVANSVKIQGDGKIVAAGYATTASNIDIALVRYNTNGSLDTSFGTNGKVTTAIGSGNDFAQASVIQANGKIVIAGGSFTGSNEDFAIVRYNGDGSLDTTFNGTGKATIGIGTGNDEGRAIALQPDNKFVVAGYYFNGSNNDFALVRYDGEYISPTLQFSSPTYTVAESGGSATITVLRNGDAAVVATVNYATSDGTATAGSDYTATSGTLTFNQGEIIKTFNIPILNDAVFEGLETVNLTLTNANNATLAAPSTATLGIDDRPPNDNFINSQFISGPTGAVTGTLINATKEAGEPSHAGLEGHNSIWYRWTAPSSGTVFFDTRESQADPTFGLAPPDTLLAVYTGNNVNALTLVASNDDASSSLKTSAVSFNAIAGTEYRIVVDAFRGNLGYFGSVTLNWSVGSRIIGHVTLNVNGQPLSGRQFTLSGTASGTAVSDSNGFYSFDNLPIGGNYTIAAPTNNPFSPNQISYSALSGIIHDADFQEIGVTVKTSTISGRVTSSGVGVEGVQIRLNGAVHGLTRSDGSFTFSSLPVSGEYEVTPDPQAAGFAYTFNPTSVAHLAGSNNHLGLSFTVTSQQTAYDIGGQVRDGLGQPISGVTLTLGGGSVAQIQSDADGNYSFNNLSPGANYSVSASKTAYMFAPPTAAVPNLNANQKTVDFTATAIRTLTIASSNPGNGVNITVSPTDNDSQGSGTTQFTRAYNNSSNVSLTAPATAGGNNFQKWLKDGADFANNALANVNVTLDADHTMTAVYVAPTPTRTLTVASSNPNSGVNITVTPNDNNANGNGSTQFTRVYNLNTSVSLTAPATSGVNNFQKWLKDGADFPNNQLANVNVTLDADHTLTAVYLTPTRTLTVASSNPASGVNITVSPNDNSANGNGATQFTRTYNLNTSVSLTAPATSGVNTFQKWLKDGADFANNQLANVSMTLDADHTMTAVYLTPTRTLTVASLNPISGVNVTVTPNDNSAQGNGTTQFTRTYNLNTSVSLTAPATAGGNNFQKWLKDGADFANNHLANISVTLDAAHTMTAVYVTPTRMLTVSSSNQGNAVNITVSPNDNSAQGNGTTQFTRTYNLNTSVSLTAPATSSGNNFQKWLKDGADFANNQLASVNVTLDLDHTMTAVYATATRSLIVASTNPASGVNITVTPSDNGGLSNGSTQFTRVYNSNTSVGLTAPVTAAGNNFQKWQRDGADFSTNQSVSLTMDSDHTLTAIYVTPTALLTVGSVNPASGVNISVSPNDNTANADGTTGFNRTYNLNTSVSLIAPAKAGVNNFQKWQRDGVDFTSTQSTTVTMDASHTMTAIYATPSVQFTSGSYSVGEGDLKVDLTVSRTDGTGVAGVSFATTDLAGSQKCSDTNGLASARCDYIGAIGNISFAPGETSKTISILIIDDSYLEGAETFNVSLSNPVGAILGGPSTATVIINENESATGSNPSAQAGFFVREHYFDFLNRIPDSGGLAFWTNEIVSCGSDQACIQLKRINVSAAYFLSTEFQTTGYLVERIYKSAYGDASGTSTFNGLHQLPVPIVRFNEFLPDTQEIGKGVIVGQAGWELVLETNKQAFVNNFVQRGRFTGAYQTDLTPTAFVNRLFANAGVTPSANDLAAAIAEFGSATNTSDMAARARVLRLVAENSVLNQQEFNRAFVLMQFFGYLRRNPDDAPDSDHTGYDFWLTKLNEFGGNFVDAEMVKAFIVSGEYQGRFGP